MIKFSRVAVAAALLAASGFAAAATSATVDAQANSIAGGIGYDTGVSLTAGESFSAVVANAGTTFWKNDPSDSYEATAAGDAHFGTYTAYVGTTGYTFNIGTLVGEVGNGAYFAVGTSYTGSADVSGDLKLFFWDSDAGNNSGVQSVAVSAVPEPANMALMALALGAFALTRRRKA
jgi:hypothetical protein